MHCNVAIQRTQACLLFAVLLCLTPLLLAQESIPDSEIPRHPLELMGLVAPDRALVEIETALSTATNDDERALLWIAKTNACRVMANWICQRDSGKEAARLGARSGNDTLAVRGKIAEARGRIHLGDFAQGERVLGEAQILLARTPGKLKELDADVMLAYTALSHILGKHETSVAYADRGLAALGEAAAPTMRSRLLRNRARAKAILGDLAGARSSLTDAQVSAAGLNDPKLNAELALESARVARMQGDTATQQREAARVLELATLVPTSQMEGLGHEALALAAMDTRDFEVAELKFDAAYQSFAKLGLVRDQLRVVREQLGLALERRTSALIWSQIVRNFLRLEREVAGSDRVKAAEDLETRLKYAEQKNEVDRLAAEAQLSQQRTVALAAENRLQLWLIALSVVVLSVLGYFFVMQRRALDLERMVNLRTSELATTNAKLQDSNKELERAQIDLVQSGMRADLIFSALTEALPGQVIDGKYRIESVIGTGSFGTVYRAIHLLLDTPVAIKVFKPVANQKLEETVLRLRTEGVSAFRIQHPNAVQVLDVGISMDSLPYMTMELLEGETLEAVLWREGPLPWIRVAGIVSKLAGALSAAHRAGVIHRDVKPSNVLMCAGQESGEFPKLLDFGIAKLVSDSPATPKKNSTASGSFLGTPNYMAPERFVNQPYDGSSDVYSLGVLAFELLSASKPFLGDEDNYVTVAMQHLQTPPPSLFDRVSNLPRALGDLVQRMLAKDPAARPSADAVATELGLLLTGEQVVVRSDPSSTTNSKHQRPTPTNESRESRTPTLRVP